MGYNIIIVDDIPKNQDFIDSLDWIEYEDGTHVINSRYMAEWRAEHA